VRPVSEPSQQGAHQAGSGRWRRVRIEITEGQAGGGHTSAIQLGQGFDVRAGGEISGTTRPKRACSSIWDATGAGQHLLVTHQRRQPDSSQLCFDVQNRGHGLPGTPLLFPE